MKAYWMLLKSTTNKSILFVPPHSKSMSYMSTLTSPSTIRSKPEKKNRNTSKNTNCGLSCSPVPMPFLKSNPHYRYIHAMCLLELMASSKSSMMIWWGKIIGKSSIRKSTMPQKKLKISIKLKLKIILENRAFLALEWPCFILPSFNPSMTAMIMLTLNSMKKPFKPISRVFRKDTANNSSRC